MGSFGFSRICFRKSPPSDFVPVGDRRGPKILSPPIKNLEKKPCTNQCPGGDLTFFQVGVFGPDFRSVGLANWHLLLKRGGGLWVENFQIWGLVSWKFPNLGPCELKISQFGWKLRLQRLKFPNFLKRGSCELTLLLEMGPLRAAGEAEKGVFRATHPHIPFLGQSPPPPGSMLSCWSGYLNFMFHIVMEIWLGQSLHIYFNTCANLQKSLILWFMLDLWPLKCQHEPIEYRSDDVTKNFFWISVFWIPCIDGAWWKTSTAQIRWESVHGGPRYGRMNT